MDQCRYANGGDKALEKRYSKWKWVTASCNDKRAHTSSVGKYQPNGFGLQDTLGNVMGVGGGLLAPELPGSSAGRECLDTRGGLFETRIARRCLGQRTGGPPLRQPHRGHRREPGQRLRVPGCPDAHPLSRYLLTSREAKGELAPPGRFRGIDDARHNPVTEATRRFNGRNHPQRSTPEQRHPRRSPRHRPGPRLLVPISPVARPPRWSASRAARSSSSATASRAPRWMCSNPSSRRRTRGAAILTWHTPTSVSRSCVSSSASPRTWSTWTRARYEHAARALDETGRRVGAWRKTHRARASG